MLTGLPPGPPPVLVRVLRTVAVLGFAGYAVSTLPGVRPHPGHVALLDTWWNTAVFAAGVLLCVLRGVLHRPQRLPWLFLGAGMALWTAGNLFYLLVLQDLDPLPVPSLADAGWVAFYPFAYAAVVMLVRGSVRHFHGSMWLDGLVAMLGAAALAADLALDVVVRNTGGTPTDMALALGYPVGDVLLLVLVLGVCALFGWRPPPVWMLLAVGLGGFAIADTAFMVGSATGSYQAGGPLDPLWLLAPVLLGLAAWAGGSQPRQARLEGWRVLVVPAAFAFSSLALLASGAFRSVSPAATLLAAAAILAALARTGLTYREVRELATSRQQARTDDLTGLANRRRVYERVEAVLAEQPPRPAAVLLLDLDRFKEVNDGLGHAAGDRVLCEIAHRLAREVRPDDVVARLGGDEFAVLLLDVQEEDALLTAKRLCDAVERVVLVDGLPVHVAASIGIALHPAHGLDVNTLLRRADVAMYACKDDGSSHRLWSPGALDDERGLLLREELRAALHSDELVLHYQPKVHLESGQVRGVEALVRWQHPERGLLGPDRFLPIAETTGLMTPLTTVLLGTALRQCRAWRDEGLELSVAVNLSPSTLLDPDLGVLVRSLLRHLDLPADALELEVTETVLLGQRQRACATLAELREQGIRIALDDYGTGFSSLAYLAELPVDELKLDKSFVLALGGAPRDEAIVRSTVELAHALGLTLVAEGVENGEVLRALVAYGCDSAQGFHLARPMPADALTPWLHQQRAGRAQLVPAQATPA